MMVKCKLHLNNWDFVGNIWETVVVRSNLASTKATEQDIGHYYGLIVEPLIVQFHL